jgi:hypothetical protein
LLTFRNSANDARLESKRTNISEKDIEKALADINMEEFVPLVQGSLEGNGLPHQLVICPLTTSVQPGRPHKLPRSLPRAVLQRKTTKLLALPQ